MSLNLSAVAAGHTGSTEQSATGRESSGAAQTLGPSAHTLPSEDEKRRLHYELQTTPPPLLSPSSRTLFPFLPPSPPLSLPPCFPSTLPASSICSRACPSQKRGSRLPKKTSHPMVGLCCAVHRERETRRKMKGQSDGIYRLNLSCQCSGFMLWSHLFQHDSTEAQK